MFTHRFLSSFLLHTTSSHPILLSLFLYRFLWSYNFFYFLSSWLDYFPLIIDYFLLYSFILLYLIYFCYILSSHPNYSFILCFLSSHSSLLSLILCPLILYHVLSSCLLPFILHHFFLIPCYLLCCTASSQLTLLPFTLYHYLFYPYLLSLPLILSCYISFLFCLK